MKKEKISSRLKYILKYRGITQAELARATNISESMITCYVKNLYLPKPNTITLFANFLNVNEAWLAGYDVPMEKTADEKKGKYGEYDLLVEGFKNLKNEQKELIKSMIKLFEIENKKG